ncbi:MULTISPECIES: DUF4307 domain-containing protein [unclassified Arthrobacter]|uniref:DUF4307 domain-containing protein n=1 Tax=unclassified Arthrobacter TaxID=235627 RepID=UPI002E0CF5B9|nr:MULTISPECIES: DUF4307 domain-containing protein [unclassified Arthrobacter]MEC5190321.1 Flp pilus assembly protein TadG [Arthrobacter sp. MP_M4]MEC5202694.1 Flp pilus assembly protein TadG [Arthrobacter sp. MP_M7]
MTSKDQPAAPAPASPSLANRYGGQKRTLSGRAKRIVLVLAIAAGIAFMAWISTSNATESVTFKDIGYSTPDATLVEVDFQVTKEPATAATCSVKAMDAKFAVVGWKVVDIAPNAADAGTDGGRTTAHRATLRTESQAVSGVVDSCWIPDAKR